MRRALAAIRTGAVLDPPALWVAFHLAGAMSVVGQMGLFRGVRSFLLGVFVAYGSTVVAAAFLLLLRVWWVRTARPLPVSVAVTAFAVVGAGRMALQGVMHTWLALPTLFSDLVRMGVGVMQAVTWLVVASLFYADRDHFLAARAEALEEQARQEEAERRQFALSGAIAHELAEAVSRRVSESVNRSRTLMGDLHGPDDSRESLRRVASMLRASIDEDIRPMSRELWVEPPNEQLHLTLLDVLRLGCYARPYPVAVTVLLGLGFTASLSLSLPDSTASMVLLVVQLVILGASLWLANRLRRDSRDAGRAFWLGVMLSSLATGAPALVMPRFGWTLEQSQYVALMLTSYTFLVVVCLAITLGLAGTHASVLARARLSLSASEVHQRVHARELAAASRLLARHLHSSLQGRLMAIALELERAAEERDSAVALDAMRRLDLLLETPLVQALRPPSVELVPALTNLVREWSAIADVRLDIRLDDDCVVGRPDIVLGIAEEAIANAVRHAHARTVRFRVTSDGDDVLVEVRNDGSVSRGRGAGLGSKWLDMVSPDNWQLEPLPADAGMVLRVRLPDTLVRMEAE